MKYEVVTNYWDLEERAQRRKGQIIELEKEERAKVLIELKFIKEVADEPKEEKAVVEEEKKETAVKKKAKKNVSKK